MIWQIKVILVQPGTKDNETLDKALNERWEPFAVTWDGRQWDYHLRKMVWNLEDE